MGNGLYYGWHNWEFNREKFGQDVRAARKAANLTVKETDTMLGFTGFIGNVEMPTRAYYPSFSNYIALCNLLDLDPRAYFQVDDVQGESNVERLQKLRRPKPKVRPFRGFNNDSGADDGTK